MRLALHVLLSSAQVPKGVEMAVCQMSVGEHCLLRCYSDYSFSQTRRPPSVPADATLFFELRVLRYEKEKNLHEMTLDDKYAYCDQRRALGKELFATGRKPRSAARQYEKALSVLDSIQEFDVAVKTRERKRSMQVLFWVNQAQ